MIKIKDIVEGIAMFRSVVESIKAVIEILPKEKAKGAARMLEDAERKLRISEAEIAKGLGYELCRCTFPPQIMLHTGDAEYGEIFRCPACKRTVSPDDMPPL